MSGNLNILQISRHMGQGGVEKVVFQLCEKAPFNMVVASTGGVFADKLAVEKYTIPDIEKKDPVTVIKTFFILKSIIKRNRINVIHSHHRMAAFYARVLRFFNPSLKLVYTAHVSYFDKFHLTRWSLKKTKIIACGEAVKENLVNYYKISTDHITVIRNSVKIPKDFRIPVGISRKKGTINIGIAGRMSEQKGIDIFLDAIYRLPDLSDIIHCYVVGGGKLLQFYEEETKKRKMGDVVTFLGYREDVLDIINRMDIMAIPSRYEGMPLITIECLALGKAIIASNIKGNDEIITDRKNGLLFEKENSKELANMIRELIADDTLREKLGENAKKSFHEKFSYEIFLESYYSVYKDL